MTKPKKTLPPVVVTPRSTSPSPDTDEKATINDSAVMEIIRGNTLLANRYHYFQSAVPLPTLRSRILSSVTEHSPPHSPVREETSSFRKTL